jgi:hypothetical protein
MNGHSSLTVYPFNTRARSKVLTSQAIHNVQHRTIRITIITKQNMKSIISILILASTLAFAAEKNEVSGTLFGPTGIIGSVSKNQIQVSDVQQHSPADSLLKSGDLIVGVGKTAFSDINKDMAMAIDLAETEAAGGKMILMLKGGKNVTITLPVLGSYSKTAPFSCAKTDKIITMTAEKLMKKGEGDRLAIEELALMATGEKKYMNAAFESIRKKEWAKGNGELLPNSQYCTWYWGYRAIVLAEYYMLTKDESVMPALRSLALSLAKGQDTRGVYGHRVADPNNFNRIPGYGPMNQTTLSCMMGMLMARKAGVHDPKLDQAIKTTNSHLQRYVGKGAFPYGMGSPNSAGFNNNGTSGSATVCLELLGDKAGTKFYSICSAASYDGLEQGHASAFFNPLWTSIGAARSGAEVASEHFKRTLWFYNLRRHVDGTWSGDDKTGNMDGVALLNYCLGRKVLIVTGREMDPSIWAKDGEVMDTIHMSKLDFEKKSPKEILEISNNHPMPQIRRKAMGALESHRQELTPFYVEWLKNGTAQQKMIAVSQFGWWIKSDVKLPQLPAIAAILTNPKEPEEVRRAAAESIAYMGKPAQKYYMDVLKLADTTEDVGFGKILNTLCDKPFQAGLVTDKKLLYKVALRLASDRDQGPRGQGLEMLAGMPLEDFHLVADKVIYVIEGKDPDWTSYSAPQQDIGPAIALLASLNIKEGLDYAMRVSEFRPKAKAMFCHRATWVALSAYGSAAKETLELYHKGLQHKEFKRATGPYKEMLQAVEGDTRPPRKLISMKAAIAAGK